MDNQGICKNQMVKDMHSQNKEVSKVHDGRSLPKRERFITLLASAGKNWTSQAAFCLPMKPKVATEKEESDLVTFLHFFLYQ